MSFLYISSNRIVDYELDNFSNFGFWRNWETPFKVIQFKIEKGHLQ